MSVSNGMMAHSANTYKYERDPDELPSEAIVAAVSDVAERPAVTQFGGRDDRADVLSPLYEYVDPDALDALFAAKRGRDSGCSVTFSYGEYRVTVEKRTVTVTGSA